MKGIDTNILVRYLVEDDERQTQKVWRVLAASRQAGENVYISCIVLCEVVWVLDRRYGYSKTRILDYLEQLLVTEVFVVEEKDAVRRALAFARRGKGDFADYLIGELNVAHGCRFTVTFDRPLRSGAFSVL